jgi:hypothetical protein
MKQPNLKFTPEQFNSIIHGILYRYSIHVGIKDQEILNYLKEFGEKMDEMLKQKEQEKLNKNEKSI